MPLKYWKDILYEAAVSFVKSLWGKTILVLNAIYFFILQLSSGFEITISTISSTINNLTYIISILTIIYIFYFILFTFKAIFENFKELEELVKELEKEPKQLEKRKNNDSAP